MALDSYIKDPFNGDQLNVLEQEGQNCIPVVTQEYKQYLNKSEYFSNSTYGIDMNQDFSQIESTENVHNGNDNTYWTATITDGQPSSFDFSSTEQAHSGTQSIDCTGAKNGNEFQLANDTIIAAQDYDRFSGWVYITQYWDNGDEVNVYLYNTADGTNSSENIVDLSNYVNTGNNDVWQKFNIPMSDFGSINNYDAIRVEINASDDPPDFYLDDLVLEELTDEPAIFTIKPSKGRWWEVVGMGIVLVVPYDSTMVDATMPRIPYNGLLGVSLVNGINYQRQEEGEIIFSIIIKDMIDILGQHHARIASSGYDGTNTWVKIDIDFHVPFRLKPEFGDFISFNISDDLSNLQVLRVVAAIREEKRTTDGYYDRNGLLRVTEAK